MNDKTKWENAHFEHDAHPVDGATSKPAAAQEAVAYLDIGAGGYLELGSNLPEVQLLALPKGRHALGIIGTYGIDGYAAAPVAAAPEWQPIDTAPKDDRVLVRCESGSVYAAHWVQNPMTGDEAWLVCALEDGTQMLVHPVEWMPLPLAARPQGVKDV